METRTVHDPFIGKDVQISDRLVDRLRGKYASGPHLPNGNPEFGWKQFEAPPIQHEAATHIEALEEAVRMLEFVAYASLNRGHLLEDRQMTEAACKGLGLAHRLLGITPKRDEARCRFDV